MNGVPAIMYALKKTGYYKFTEDTRLSFIASFPFFISLFRFCDNIFFSIYSYLHYLHFCSIYVIILIQIFHTNSYD